MGIVIALLTALFWGCTPLWTRFLGGNPVEQLLGTTYGASIFGILILIVKQPDMNESIFWWCFIAGIGWSIGQLYAYQGLKDIGISTTMPMVAGVQLVGVNLIGVLFFGSWTSSSAKIIGSCAIVLIFLGVLLTTRGNNQNSSSEIDQKDLFKAVMKLLIGTGVGYTACSTLPKIPEANGWSTFPPQALGMIISAVVIAILVDKNRGKNLLFSKHTLKNIITGINSGIGTLLYLIAIMLCGISTGFTLSQMCTVVSTFGGLVFFKENKHSKQLTFTLSGLCLVMMGGIITGFIK